MPNAREPLYELEGKWALDPDVVASCLIQKAMDLKGLSVTALEVESGVWRPNLSAYISRRRQPTVPSLVRILRAAGLDLNRAPVPFIPPNRF